MRWGLCFLLVLNFLSAAQADVTVVQSVQAVDPGGALQPAQEMTLYLTANKLRLDSGDVSSIIRADKRTTYSLLHSDKAFITLPHATFPTLKAQQDAEPVRTKRTGKTEKINGFNCAEVEVERSDGTTLDAWMTLDPSAIKAQDSLKAWQSGEYAALLNGMGLQQGAVLPGMEGMAIRTIVLDEQRKPTVRVELKQLSSATIRADLFEPPSGYKSVSMDAVDEIPAPNNAAELSKEKKTPDAKP